MNETIIHRSKKTPRRDWSDWENMLKERSEKIKNKELTLKEFMEEKNEFKRSKK